MSFQWTNENTFKLIEMFKERGLLWNTRLEEYRDRHKKHDAWCDIAKTFKVEKSVVEKKMKALIGQFQRELKKPKSGAGHDEISKWFAFKKMMFLRHRCKTANTNNFVVKDVSDNNEKEQAGDVKKEGQIEKDGLIEKEGGIEKHPNTFTSSKHSTYRKRVRPQDKIEEALTILKQIHGTRKRRDEFDLFGEQVAVKVRNLNNSLAKHTAQFHINNILYKAAIGEYDWPSIKSDSSF